MQLLCKKLFLSYYYNFYHIIIHFLKKKIHEHRESKEMMEEGKTL